MNLKTVETKEPILFEIRYSITNNLKLPNEKDIEQSNFDYTNLENIIKVNKILNRQIIKSKKINHINEFSQSYGIKKENETTKNYFNRIIKLIKTKNNQEINFKQIETQKNLKNLVDTYEIQIGNIGLLFYSDMEIETTNTTEEIFRRTGPEKVKRTIYFNYAGFQIQKKSNKTKIITDNIKQIYETPFKINNLTFQESEKNIFWWENSKNFEGDFPGGGEPSSVHYLE